MDTDLANLSMSSRSFKHPASEIDNLISQIKQRSKLSLDSNAQKLEPESTSTLTRLSEHKTTPSSSSNSSVFIRLNQDAKRKQLSLNLKREKEINRRLEEEDRFIKHKKMSQEATNRLVKRMNDDVKRRSKNLEQMRISKKQAEDHQFDSVIKARHPSRKLDPKVQSRLLQEDKVIEALYGIPNRFKKSSRIKQK